MRGVTVGVVKIVISLEFQLTRLMRGVTRTDEDYSIWLKHFNSHASCEA